MAKKLKHGERYMGNDGKKHTWNAHSINIMPEELEAGPLAKRVSIRDIITGSQTRASSSQPTATESASVIAPPIQPYKSTPSTYKSYYEKLRDPRWQKKRLGIMERDNFSCTSCGSTIGTLNVHHRVAYRKNTDPWDYENDELTTLCEECHSQISELVNEITSIAMGRCYCVDSAVKMRNLMYQIDGMNPWELTASAQILKVAIKQDIYKDAIS